MPRQACPQQLRLLLTRKLIGAAMVCLAIATPSLLTVTGFGLFTLWSPTPLTAGVAFSALHRAAPSEAGRRAGPKGEGAQQQQISFCKLRSAALHVQKAQGRSGAFTPFFSHVKIDCFQLKSILTEVLPRNSSFFYKKNTRKLEETLRCGKCFFFLLEMRFWDVSWGFCFEGGGGFLKRLPTE